MCERQSKRVRAHRPTEGRMKEMNKTYAIVEMIDGEQIQLVRSLRFTACVHLCDLCVAGEYKICVFVRPSWSVLRKAS